MAGDIHCHLNDHVAVITLDRPPVNAMTPAMMEELTAVFDAVHEDPELRVAVLTATGTVFCAGSDMKGRSQVDAGAGATSRYQRLSREMLNAILECRVPVIAAVNGAALGGGLSLVASCDIVVASEAASFGLPEIDVGLLGGARHAARLLGHLRARRLLLTGERIGASELHRVGVIDLCVSAEELQATARQLAAGLAAKSPAAIRLAKRALNLVETMALREGYRLEQDFTRELTGHPDSREAMSAFVEKRPPSFDRPEHAQP